VRDASKAEELGVPLADLGSLVGQHVQQSEAIQMRGKI